MKSNLKLNITALTFFGIIFVSSFLSVNNLNFYAGIENNIYLKNHSLQISKVSGIIYINNNWSDAKIKGICYGSGTYADPYVIEGLEIDCGGSGSCIKIENSTEYFKIINCTLYNSGLVDLLIPTAAIVLFNASNGLIAQNNCSFNDMGILIWGDNNSISKNFLTNNDLGIFSIGVNIISENNINSNLGGIAEVGGAMISLNNITNNDDFGITLGGASNSSIIGNSLKNNEDGIVLIDCRYINISKNECNNNKFHGIYLNTIWGFPSSQRFNWISDNIVNDNLYGITLEYTEYSHIINNIIYNNEISGILLNNSNYNNILENQIEENYYGINMIESRTNHIFYNTINYNFYGISLNKSCQNSISNNTLHYNRICIMDDDYCYNIFKNNDCIGIKDTGPEMIFLLVIISTTLIGLTVIIFIYLYHKTKLKLDR